MEITGHHPIDGAQQAWCGVQDTGDGEKAILEYCHSNKEIQIQRCEVGDMINSLLVTEWD